MKREDWLKIVNTIDFPIKITDQYLDSLGSNGEKWELFKRWGFCYRDLSNYDLSELSPKYLKMLTFNSSTKWPPEERMPKGFNPEKILEQGKTPLCSISDMHQKGITGKGVHVAVIDKKIQGLNHADLKNSKISLELSDRYIKGISHFHGQCVLANLCGKTVGIAPEANVFYYEHSSSESTQQEINIALKDILNKIKSGTPIKVVNISGPLYRSLDSGNIYNKLKLKAEQLTTKFLINELDSKGCKVVSAEVFDKDFAPAHFSYDSNYLNPQDLKRPYWYTDVEKFKSKVAFACGGKVVPEFCSEEGYKYEWDDCASWTIPQVVGLYTLGLQQNSNLTWKEFVSSCHKNVITNQNGVNVINPAQVIKACMNNNINKNENE